MENGFAEETTAQHTRATHHRSIDPTVEKLAYPETKTEYVVDKLISGGIMAVGFLLVAKGAPYLMNRLNNRGQPRQ